MQGLAARAVGIRLAAFDVDGVLTDGGLILGPGGEEYKRFHSRDGHGLKMLMRGGVEVVIITARDSAVVTRRMQGLGIRHVYQGVADKWAQLSALMTELGVASRQVAYVGDDIIDLPILCRVGLSVAVADAHPSLFAYCHTKTRQQGGHGAVREVCDLILRAQGRYDEQIRRFLP